MSINCTFQSLGIDPQHYTCKIVSQIIPEINGLNLQGDHERRKSKHDVTAIRFENCFMTKVPMGLTKLFPKLRALWINSSNLKNVTRYDLAEYRNLEELYFYNNDIEFLPGDLFQGFRKLTTISFSANQLKRIEPNILQGLDKSKLKIVSFGKNPNYNVWYNAEDNSNQEVEDVEKYLLNKYCHGSRNVRESINRKRDFNVRPNQKLNPQQPDRNRNNNPLIDFIKQDEKFKDFRILINDQEFAVHKIVLAAQSPVLADILSNNLEAEELKLSDISEDIFGIIINYFYTDQLPHAADTNFLHLFAAAGQLQIEKLKNHAAYNLYKLIDAKNAFGILKLGNKYNHHVLMKKSFDEMKKKYPKLKLNDNFLEDPEAFADVMDILKEKEENGKKKVNKNLV